MFLMIRSTTKPNHTIPYHAPKGKQKKYVRGSLLHPWGTCEHEQELKDAGTKPIMECRDKTKDNGAGERKQGKRHLFRLEQYGLREVSVFTNRTIWSTSKECWWWGGRHGILMPSPRAFHVVRVARLRVIM